MFRHVLPERVQRMAWNQLAKRMDEQRAAEFLAASDPDGLEHISASLRRCFQ